MTKRSITYMMILVLTGLFASQGCATDPYTGEQKVSKTALGGVIGAASGAAVGAATGKGSEERRKRALIGAGIGGLAGGSIGLYMDYQESKLRERLQGTGVSVTRTEDRIILNMPGNITFGINSADVNAQFYEVLNSVSLVLNEYNKTLINITGHTDITGREDYNQQLSERRAASVSRYLESQGVNGMRIMTVGMGIHQPIATNETEQGRQLNRRVEIELVPLTE
jgi:outer membrane protein OmpA-like peptidoglycan-associated protein